MSAAPAFGPYDAEVRVIERPGGAQAFVRLDRLDDGEWNTQALFPLNHVPLIIAALGSAAARAERLGLTPAKERVRCGC